MSGETQGTGESARQAAVDSFGLDPLEETAYDDLTRMAAEMCRMPIALISIVDGERQWFKSRVGLQATETPREFAFCAHAVQNPHEVMVVPDAALDARFASNPLVTGEPNIRFYAGAPLVTSEGQAIGTVCVIGNQPATLTEEQLDTLRFLSRQVMSKLEARRAERLARKPA